MAGMGAYDTWKTTEPIGDGPTKEWESARAMMGKAEALLEASPSRHGAAWLGMGPSANRCWERRDRRINRILSRLQDMVWADSCPGCGGYSDGGRCHGASCRAAARCSQ